MSADLQALRIDRTTASRRPSRRRRSWWGPLLLLTLVAGTGFVFQRPLRQWLDRLRLPTVETLRVTESLPSAAGVVSGKAANGYIVAARRAALSADTPGRIVELNVTEGSEVRAGDLVARLYSEEYQADLDRSEAELAVAVASLSEVERQQNTLQSSIAEAEQRVLTAQAEIDASLPRLHWLEREEVRFRGLLEQRTVSDQEFDQVRSDRESQSLRIEALEAQRELSVRGLRTERLREAEISATQTRLEAQVRAQTAVRDRARATLEKTEVRAPFDGIVVLKDAEVGEVVSPNSQGGSNARGSVCTMVDRASLEVQAEVPETSLEAVRMGAKVQIYLDALPDREYRGTVARIWPTANRQKATVEVRIRFDELKEEFRPEMGVRVVFLPADAPAANQEGPASRVILLPQEAIVRVEGEDHVFVVERDRAVRRDVRLGEAKNGRVVIEEGLLAGELVVLAPPGDLKDGDRVLVASR